MPRKPYRSPRDWLPDDQKRLFGYSQASDLGWKIPQSTLDEALLAAAKQQSDLAFVIRVSIGRNVSMPQLAASIDLHVDTLRDTLNGSRDASLAFLYALTDALGLDVTVAARRRKLPPEDEATRVTDDSIEGP